MKIWFVIYCKSLKDKTAEAGLFRKGYEVYRPLLSETANDGKQPKEKESLFPRYLFVRVDPEEQSLDGIKYTPGVVSFVKFGDRYSVVNESVIAEIKMCEQKMLTADTPEKELFTKGESVYINGKGFINIKATFLEKRSDNRVVVLLNMLGGMSTVCVSSCSVSRVSSY